MISLVKAISVIAKCDCDQPPIIDNEGRVERIVFHNHVLCVKWTENNEQVCFENDHNVPTDFKFHVLQELKDVVCDFFSNHRKEYDIALCSKYRCYLLITKIA